MLVSHRLLFIATSLGLLAEQLAIGLPLISFFFRLEPLNPYVIS